MKRAQGRNRTADTRIFNPLLYRLSYLGVVGLPRRGRILSSRHWRRATRKISLSSSRPLQYGKAHMPLTQRVVRVALLSACFSWFGCHRESPGGVGDGSSRRSAQPVSAQSSPSVPRPAAEPEEPKRAADPALWEAARRASPQDLGQLADRVGAGELLERWRGRGEFAQLALQALAYSRDAQLAEGPLCAALSETENDEAALLRQTLTRLLTRPHNREWLEQAGRQQCQSRLLQLERSPTCPPKVAAWATAMRLQQPVD